ncbi:helix-turn-helix transcriptional regulator [bacterium]|nr:helix-turn-helix transcriptional regulator [bacterium]
MENQVCKILGDNIKKFRKIKGITQNELAELAGIEVKSLSLIETGKGFISAKNLEKLSSILNVSFSDLFSSQNSENNKKIYSEILNNLKLIKNNNLKLNTVSIVVKSLL